MGEGRCSKIFDLEGGVQAKKRHTHGLYIGGVEVGIVRTDLIMDIFPNMTSSGDRRG